MKHLLQSMGIMQSLPNTIDCVLEVGEPFYLEVNGIRQTAQPLPTFKLMD